MSVSIWPGDSSDYDMNLANSNFISLMIMLDVPIDREYGLCGRWEGQQLHEITIKAKSLLESLRSSFSERELEWPPNGATICQTDIHHPGYVASRLSAFVAVCEEAIENNVPVHFA